MTQRFELVLHMMKLIQHPAPAGVVLRSALAALLLATALPALAQFEVEPESAMQESASRDLIAHEMLTALVTAFHMLTGAVAQVQHFAQNNQSPPQAPSQLGVEQVMVDPAKAVPSDTLKSLGVRQDEGVVGLPQADTLAKCEGDNASAECMLPGQTATDWKKLTGIELDPISGAPLIPGVTLNPTGH
jgi:hypothetical protein